MPQLKKLQNVLWLLVGKFGVVFISVFTFIAFAFFLTPSQLGTGALVIALVELVSVFFSSMIETPLARKDALNEDDKSTAFWFGAVFSIILSTFLVFIISLIFEDEVMLLLVAFGCLKFFFSNISRSYIAELRIKRHFKALSMRTLIGKVFGALTAILFAYKGAGAASVVVQPVVMEAVSFLILALGAGIPPLNKSRLSSFRSIINEGFAYAVKFSCNSLLEKMTVIILSITTSMEIVGFYTFARRLVELPRAAIQSAIITYAVPVFSKRVKENSNVTKFYHEISFLTFTLCGIGFVWYGVLLSELIPYIFGTKWDNSIYIFLSLCFVAMIRFLDLYIPVFLAASGRSKIGLLSEVLNTSFCIILVWILSANYGVWGAVFTAFFYSVINIIIRFRTLPKSFYTTRLYFEKFRTFLSITFFSLLNVGLNFFYIDEVIYRLLISALFLLLIIVFIDRLNRDIKKRLLDLFK